MHNSENDLDAYHVLLGRRQPDIGTFARWLIFNCQSGVAVYTPGGESREYFDEGAAAGRKVAIHLKITG